MKPIIFNDGTDDVAVQLSESGRFFYVDDSIVEVVIRAEAVDKLIEALQKVKEELNRV